MRRYLPGRRSVALGIPEKRGIYTVDTVEGDQSLRAVLGVSKRDVACRHRRVRRNVASPEGVEIIKTFRKREGRGGRQICRFVKGKSVGSFA